MSKTAKLLTKMAAMQEIKGDEIVKKIEKLVKIPSPTGFTGKVRDKKRKIYSSYSSLKICARSQASETRGDRKVYVRRFS